MDTKRDNNIYIRLKECLANDWYDLAEHLDNITGALIDVPESGHAIRCELIGWCDAVDGRIEALTRAPSSSLLTVVLWDYDMQCLIRFTTA